MAQYFIYFFAIVVSVSELAGLTFMGAIVALCVRLWQPNPNYTEDTLMINNIHTFLSSLGAIFLCGNGIILFRLLRNHKTTSIQYLHAFVLGLTLICTIWGVWTGYKAVIYDAEDRKHFGTLHGLLGVFSLVLLIVQYVVGIFIYLTDAVTFQFAESCSGIHGFIGVSSLIFNSVTGITGLSMKANTKAMFELVTKPAVEPDYENFTVEYKILFTAATFMTLFAWNFFYITVNPYFEWTMIEKY